MAREPASRARIYSDQPLTLSNGRPRSVDPHSPWQLMVEKARKELRIPLRQLATLAQVPPGSLFNWVRNERGGPSRPLYTANVNRRFAKALKIDEKDLADAYNKSEFSPVDYKANEERPRPVPHHLQENSPAQMDGLRHLLGMLQASGRASFTLAELQQLAALILPPEPPAAGSQAT